MTSVTVITTSIGNGQDLTTVLGKILRIDPLDPSLTRGSADPVSANGQLPCSGEQSLHQQWHRGARDLRLRSA